MTRVVGSNPDRPRERPRFQARRREPDVEAKCAARALGRAVDRQRLDVGCDRQGPEGPRSLLEQNGPCEQREETGLPGDPLGCVLTNVDAAWTGIPVGREGGAYADRENAWLRPGP